MNIIDVLQYVAFFCWTVFSIFVILGISAQIYRPKKEKEKARNVEYVLVSVANRKVEKALYECIDHTKKMLGSCPRILVDEGSELIPNLRGNPLVIVPSMYRRDLVGKGRAMNYFIENEVQSERWYAFIDDDNLVLDDSFLYEIPYYEKRGFVVMNPLVVPRKGRSTLTYIMDFIRFFDDRTVSRFFTGLLRRPLIGCHGEFLTVKGEILKEIGYDNRSIVEDFRFGSELVQRGYKIWQSKTRVSIKSANSLGDLMKQRGRWFKGIFKDWRYCPLLMKGILSWRLLIWFLGVFGTWALSPLWFFWGPFYFAIPGGLYCWGAYLYGSWKSKKIYYLLLIPLFSIFESISIFSGLKQKDFVVIDKN